MPALLLGAGPALPTTAAIGSNGVPEGAFEGLSAASRVPSAPPFRPESESPTFPLAGAVAMALLICLAVVLAARRRRGGPAGPAPAVLRSIGWPRRVASSHAGEAEVLDVECTRRIDSATTLHVVRWSGRRVLVATGGPAGAVVIDRDDSETPETIDR